MTAHYWVILGIVLLIGEIFTMDFSLTCFAIACFVAAVLSWIGLGTYWQLAAVAATIFILLFTLRPLVLKYLNKKGEGFKSNMEALIGKELTVSQTNGQTGKYYAKNDGDLWELFCEEKLSQGDKVKVYKVDGIKLFVKKENK